MTFSSIEEILADIRAGRMVIMADDEDRENEGDLIMAAQFATPEALAFIVRHSTGIVCQPMTRERLEQLRLPQMVSENSESHRTAFTVSVDVRHGTTTGVSAHDRAKTIRALADPSSKPDDFARPGHIFPLRCAEGGVLMRAGHTEASVDLVKLAGLTAHSAVICEIVNDDGSMKRGNDLLSFAREHSLRVGTIADLIRYRLQTEKTIERVFERDVDTDFGRFRLIGYRDALSSLPHFALVRGDIAGDQAVLTRVHVRDTLSDALHLVQADNSLSLDAALRHVAAHDRGVVVILSDPGEAGSALDRLSRLGTPRDADRQTQWRRHGIGAQILADLGLRRLTVLGTPRRFLGLGGFGLEIVGYETLE